MILREWIDGEWIIAETPDGDFIVDQAAWEDGVKEDLQIEIKARREFEALRPVVDAVNARMRNG
jgi:hypothetical protein